MKNSRRVWRCVLALMAACPVPGARAEAGADAKRLSGDYACRVEGGRYYDARTPRVSLDAASGAMTVTVDAQTEFAGMATRASFGRLGQVEYWLNWRAQAGIRMLFGMRQGVVSQVGVLTLADTLARYTCRPVAG